VTWVVKLITLLRRFLRKLLLKYYPFFLGPEVPKETYRYIEKFLRNFGVHPEVYYALKVCSGLGLDLGCGGSKTHPDVIGIDLIPRGSVGKTGGQRGVVSQADIAADVTFLPIRDNSIDYIIARHILEHLRDCVLALNEWVRVLKPSGKIILICPDDEKLDTIFLDPTHKHVFTKDSLRRLVELLGTLSIIEIGDAVPGWSFYIIASKIFQVKTPDSKISEKDNKEK